MWAKPPAVQEQSSVGAGDALLAGFAWVMMRRTFFADVARWGGACGTAAAARERVGVFARADVKRLYDQVRVEGVDAV